MGKITNQELDSSIQIGNLSGLATTEKGSIIDAINEINTNKVDKETGKGLSTNDYTTDEKNKLADIQSGAEVNVNADWNASSGDGQILNKPFIPTTLDSLTDVVITGATNKQTIVYDDTTDTWVNFTFSYFATVHTYNVNIETTWVGTSAPYTQTISVMGILPTDNLHIGLIYSETYATALLEQTAWNLVNNAIPSTDTITFVCLQKKPTQSLNVLIEVVR